MKFGFPITCWHSVLRFTFIIPSTNSIYLWQYDAITIEIWLSTTTLHIKTSDYIELEG